MAESKFLKWQDQNGDGLIDICETEVPPKDVPPCPECKPNNSYIAPDWKKQDNTTPWYDEKRITYQITIQTGERSLIPHSNPSEQEAEDYVDSLFDKYADEAVVNLLIGFNKINSEDTRKFLKEHLEHHRSYLDPRPGSFVILQYGVVCEYFSTIGEYDDENAPKEEEEKEEPRGNTVVKYNSTDIATKLMMFRKSMNLYVRYYKVYQALNNGMLIQDEGDEEGKVFTPQQMQRYGDNGVWAKSTMHALLLDLDGWLNDKGYNIVGVGGGAFKARVTDIEFTFTGTYELKKLRVWTAVCGNIPGVFKGSRLGSLKSKQSWKDPRACAYFAQLDPMEQDLQAREPMPWIDFVQKYTYPRVVATQNSNLQQTIGSCVGDALKEEGKQLGQDILDDVFSLGDAIAHAFNKNLCSPSLFESEVLLEDLGLRSEDGTFEVKPIAKENIVGMAWEQAFQQLEESDQVFVELCEKILSGKGAKGSMSLKSLWKGLDRVDLCGFKGMALDTIKCLMNGLTLEKSLAIIIRSALSNLNVQNFSNLFIGLPADKQKELEDLVKQKLESGDIFRKDSTAQKVSDAVAHSEEGEEAPEQEDAYAGMTRKQKRDTQKAEKAQRKEDRPEKRAERRSDAMAKFESVSFDSFVQGLKQSSTERQTVREAASAELTEGRQASSRTLAQTLDGQNHKSGLDPSILLEAYILALIEVYSDDLLSLVDRLNVFPGAPLLAKIIALFDCPRPPLFDPNFMDFIQSIDLPFCKDTKPIILPKINNPFDWIPKTKDFSKIIFEILLVAIQRIVIAVIVKIIVKICQLLGDAICKAIATAGDIARSLPDIAAGRTQVSDIIRESICGPEASKETVDDTIADMFAKFGVGGAAFANQEDVISLMGDVSAATTRAELVSAFQGNMSAEMASIIDNAVEYQYPQFRAGLPNQNAIADLFADAGKLFPADVRASLDDFLGQLPEDDFAPANPTLCATPEQLEDFCSLRAELLSGRATSQQAREMCEELQEDLMNDLDSITDILQGDGPLANILPPIVSAPGDDCSNSLIPFESEESKEAAATILQGDLGQVQIAFAKDMLGNGPGEKNWGMMNMILSDTFGQPLTAHWRKSGIMPQYVDFLTDRTWAAVWGDLNTLLADVDDGVAMIPTLMNIVDPTITRLQMGAYPPKVAGWLQQQMDSLIVEYTLNNVYQSATTGIPIDFKDLGINRGRTRDPNLLNLSDMGYNTEINVDMEDKTITITNKGRKKTPDLTLSFKDNNKGRLNKDDESTFLYGFDVELYLSDMEKKNVAYGNVGTEDSPTDASRIRIVELFNTAEEGSDEITDGMTKDEVKAYKETLEETPIFESVLYEFMTTDDTFGTMIADPTTPWEDYVGFLQCFRSPSGHPPQAHMLQDLILRKNTSTPFNSVDQVVTFLNEASTSAFNSFVEKVAANNVAFDYGAKYDKIPQEMFAYVIGEEVEGFPAGTLYSDVEIDGKKLSNKDAVMGLSYDQWINRDNPDAIRVFYLNPMTYGGRFVNPPMYIKPLKLEGWSGVVSTLFPDFTPCKPVSTDLVDFSEIEKEISDAYNTMPEDMRLREEMECVVELPYNRLLERASKAGIQGIIKAACRIYGTSHFIKSLATFTIFSPKFPENYSSLFAQYVVENMEASFKNSHSAAWEFFNPFKDSEFWYAFLEQSVQTYGRLLDDGTITNPPRPVLDALFRLNDVQDSYDYPFRPDLREAKRAREVRLLRTLKNYRKENNLEAVQATEEDAKLILKEFVITELNTLGQRFVNNLKKENNISPQYEDLGYYVMNHMSQGGTGLTLDQIPLEELIGSLPVEGDNLGPTTGGQLSLPDGTDYVGYYHVHTTEEGQDIYMAGAYHSDETHDVLTVKANQYYLPTGHVDTWVSDAEGSFNGTPEAPFRIETYVLVNGAKKTPSAALVEIRQQGSEPLSTYYPGTMHEVVDDSSGEVVGIAGELGVRYGLQFSLIKDGQRYELTSVEIDALDLPCGEFSLLPNNSKELMCLLNNLREDSIFKLCVEYVLGLPKMLSTLAVYNDMGFFPSIGEITTDMAISLIGDFAQKPGLKVTFPGKDEEPPDYTPHYVQFEEDNYIEGWANYKDRNAGWTPLVTTWDEWDKVILRNSKSAIKKLFKTYYNSRKKKVTDRNNDYDPAKIIKNNLRSAFRRPSGGRLPWYWKRRLRPNPFNADGKMCEESD